jgi:hypothetical protein
MSEKQPIGLEQARKMISADRLLLIGLISHLIEEGAIGTDGMERLRQLCELIIDGFVNSKEPAVKFHSEEVRHELLHILSSFKL